MSSAPVAIKLPGIRLDQLRQIAAALKLRTMSAAVTHMIRQQIAAGVIPDTIPGISVERHKDEKGQVGVSIAFEDAAPTFLPVAGALKLADMLEEVVASRTSLVGVNDDYAWFSVMKRGAVGVSVKIPFTAGEGYPMANDIAIDLARVIRKAAMA